MAVYQNDYIFISLNGDNIRAIQNYLYTLYARDWTGELQNKQCSLSDYKHRVSGLAAHLLCIDDYYILTGSLKDCNIEDIMYWIHKDNKQHLVDNLTYFESVATDDVLYQHSYTVNNSQIWKAKDTYNKQDDNIEDYIAQNALLTADLAHMVHAFFCKYSEFIRIFIEKHIYS